LGAAGWSWADVLPYFKRKETAENGASATRGGSGPIGVQWNKVRDPLCGAWVQAVQAMGYPYCEDPANGEPDGIAPTQYTIRHGHRSSAATAYLKPALKRRNLILVRNALAGRVLLQGSKAQGIEYRYRGQVVRAESAREVILCGGAFNTPQLLMLSGIGPAAHLRQHGIAVRADLPVVQNLQEHIMAPIRFRRRGTSEFFGRMRLDRMALSMLNAYFFGRGYAASVPSGVIAFLKTMPGLDRPDLEFLFPLAPPFAHVWFPGLIKPYPDAFAIHPVLLHPESRGDVTLRSADPAAPVRIRHNFLAAEKDVETMRRGFRLARDLTADPALDAFRDSEMTPGAAVQSDAEIDAHIRATMITVSHPAATCPMGQGPESVLDAEMRVHGIEALRVVDASAMPELVSAHIYACTLMMAERAADLIRKRPAA
jgi:choline dehydrogenase-like flavoprotein